MIDNGYVYKIKEDSTFESTISTECLSGKLIITSSEITFNFDCEDFTMGTEEPNGTFIYSYSLGSLFELKPLNINCYEGCAYRFQKIE